MSKRRKPTTIANSCAAIGMILQRAAIVFLFFYKYGTYVCSRCMHIGSDFYDFFDGMFPFIFGNGVITISIDKLDHDTNIK